MQRSLLFYCLQDTLTHWIYWSFQRCEFSTNNSTLLHRKNSPFGDGFSAIHHKTELEEGGRGAKFGGKNTSVLVVLLRRCRAKKAGFSEMPTLLPLYSIVLYNGSNSFSVVELESIRSWLDMDAGGGSRLWKWFEPLRKSRASPLEFETNRNKKGLDAEAPNPLKVMKENNEVFCSVDWKAVGRLLPSRAVYPLLNALFDSFTEEPCRCYRWDWATFLGCFLLKLPVLGVGNLYSYRFHLPLNLSWRYLDTGTPFSFAPFWIRLNVAASVLNPRSLSLGLVFLCSIAWWLVAVVVKFRAFLECLKCQVRRRYQEVFCGRFWAFFEVLNLLDW